MLNHYDHEFERSQNSIESHIESAGRFLSLAVRAKKLLSKTDNPSHFQRESVTRMLDNCLSSIKMARMIQNAIMRSE